jgi:hypothetical protein
MSSRKVALLVAVALCAASTTAFAQSRDPLETDFDMRTASGVAHVPGLRYEYALGDTAGTHTLGAGYMLAWESYSTFWIYSLLMRFGVGPDIKLVTESFDGVGGVLGYLSGRAHLIGDAGGFGIEIAGGVGAEERGTLGAMLFGAYYASDYFEIGYAYQLPLLIERPDWLGEHLISLRVHIPVVRTAQPKLEQERRAEDTP